MLCWVTTCATAFPQPAFRPTVRCPKSSPTGACSARRPYAGYVTADFALLADRIKGNAGVRVVRTDTFTQAMVQLPGSSDITPNNQNTSYTNALPSVNLTGYLSDRTILRLGYGKGITRPDLGLLNPAVILNQVSGTGSVGNPNLKPQKADSYDLSLEHYFTSVNYVSAGLFYKRINGFFSTVSNCTTVAGAPTPIANQSCTGNQYFVSQTVNAATGTAKGIELAAQTFFDYDFMPQALHNFGVQGAFTFVDTKNPLTLNGVAVDTVQP
jgi:TonB-dependent receptor